MDRKRNRSTRRTVREGSLYIIARNYQWFGRDDDNLGKVWLQARKGRRRRVGIGSDSTLTMIIHTYCIHRTWAKGAVFGVYIECNAVAGPMRAFVTAGCVVLWLTPVRGLGSNNRDGERTNNRIHRAET